MLCLIAAAAYGRVFLRWGATGNPQSFINSQGGTHAYSADITLNGGAGIMSVYSLPDNISSVAEKLKKSMKFDEWTWNGGSMAMGKTSADGRKYNLLITSFNWSAQTLVYIIEQTAAEAELSSKPPLKHMLREIPPYPGSIPEFFMKDANTSTELAVASTSADKTDVYDFYNLSLRSTGWSPSFPTSKESSPDHQSLMMYMKGSAICCLYVNDSGSKGSNRITLLHKQQKIK